MTLPAALIRPEIAGLPTYNAGLALDRFKARYGVECLAKLDSNENPHGPSPYAVCAIEQAAAGVGAYPDAASLALRQQIGEALGHGADRIAMGNGSEDLIGAIFRAVLRSGDEVVTISPSFGLHEFGALAQGARVIKHPFSADWRFPVEDICRSLRSKPRVLIFSSPSNPAGPAISAAGFTQILNALTSDTLFVFDEAYVEFTADAEKLDAIGLLADRDLTWASLRTFSKAYGLAGLRVGYGVFSHAAMVGAIMKTRNPFGVNALAAIAAGKAFADTRHLRRSVSQITEERARVAEALSTKGFEVAPSSANFLFFNCHESGQAFAEKLRDKGVLIKGWLEEPFLNYARVTIGTPAENNAFLQRIPI